MKLIASDFDGTLRRGPRITEEDLAAISAWRTEGNIFGIITGREISSISRDVEHEGIGVDFIAVNNGAQIFDCKGNELYGVSTDGKLLPEIINYIKENGGKIGGVSHNRMHCNVFDIGRGNFEPDADMMADVEKFNQVNTYFGTEDEAKAFVENVNEKFYGIYSAYQNGSCVDIPPYGAGKAAGAMEAARIFGVEPRNIMTIGDNFNDYDMIKAFSGAAVANARTEIKKIASVIVNDFTELIRHITESCGGNG